MTFTNHKYVVMGFSLSKQLHTLFSKIFLLKDLNTVYYLFMIFSIKISNLMKRFKNSKYDLAFRINTHTNTSN